MTFKSEIDLKNTLVQVNKTDRYIMRGNDAYTKAHRDLSVMCELDIYTCSREKLEKAMSILIDRGVKN